MFDSVFMTGSGSTIVCVGSCEARLQLDQITPCLEPEEQGNAVHKL